MTNRLFGTADQDSDWDFVAVVDGIPPQQPTPDSLETVLSGDGFDVSVYQSLQFQQHIDNHFALLFPFRIPDPECVWFTSPPHHFKPDPNQIRLQSLRREILQDLSTELNQAMTTWKQGKRRKSKKRVINCIRNMQFGIQVARHNCVTDLHWSVPLHHDVFSRDFPSFEKFQAFYGPIVDALLDELKEITDAYLKMESSLPLIPSSLTISKFIEKFGKDSLLHHLSIRCEEDPRFPNAIILRRSKNESPMTTSRIVQECSHLLVLQRSSSDAYDTVLCHPMRCFPDADYIRNGAKDGIKLMSRCKAYRKYDGITVFMWMYQDEYVVSTKDTIDASEKLSDGTSVKDLFWELWENSRYKFPPKNNRQCFTFQLESQRSRSIVIPPRDEIVLISIRDLITLNEIPIEEVGSMYGWTCAERFDVDWNSIFKMLINSSPLDFRGIVMVDANFERQGFEGQHYQAIKQLPSRDAKSLPEHLMNTMASEMDDRILNYFPFPELKEKFSDLYHPYVRFCNDIDLFYREHLMGQDRSVFDARSKDHLKNDPRIPFNIFQILDGGNFVPRLTNARQIMSVYHARERYHNHLLVWLNQQLAKTIH
eukprot:TRINITY_DN4095_c0_g1_i7.p1 TRINITY_DN4095_c0_g1~~TRINITY_DN4095_c0_g1_i7.p1  ORF type:complete len:595 (-),score=177.19 TRINITY_DN4095_c0_g1_i7:199-1983(-)